MIPILLYTHSEYSFLWKVTIDLLDKNTTNDTKIFWCSDKLLDYTLPEKFIFCEYSSYLKWSERLNPHMKLIDSEYFMYIQEDWLLIDKIDNEKVTYIVDYMKSHHVEFIMSYIRGKEQFISKSKYDDYSFFKVSGHYMQPAIWSKSLFDKVLTLNIGIGEYEIAPNRITENSKCYAIKYCKTRDVSIPTLYFPHIHAICGGEWTFVRYPQLKKLVESYGIDTTTRGICKKWITEYQ